MESTLPLPSGFDTHNQTFTLINQNGEMIETNMGEIDYLRQYGVRLAINWASQLGASFILILVMLLLTRREKRKSSIFIMNVLCLVLNSIRCLTQAIWLTTEMWNPYVVITSDFSRATATARSMTDVSNIVLVVLMACIMVSLSLQVWVVCITANPLHRACIMGITTVMACAAVGLRFAVGIISIRQTKRNLSMVDYQDLLDAEHIMEAVAIWLYCSIFTFKLGYALLQRRRMAMTQFGPMQVIFIMGCQTMVLPAIFTSLQFVDSVPELGNIATTVVCVFLPLSSIWAGLAAGDKGIASRGVDAHHQLLKHEYYSTTQDSATANSGGYPARAKGSITTYTSSAKDPESPTSAFPSHHEDARSDAIYIGRQYTVESGEASKEA